MPSHSDQRPYIVAVTGGIGSGKSAGTEHFKALGITVIDTDIISRQLLIPGEPALAEIQSHFGDHVLNIDGTLNRQLIREKVFHNVLELQWLENLLHPLIRAYVKEYIYSPEVAESLYVLLVIPLLTKSKGYGGLYDRVLVVDVPETLQKKRAAIRDNTSLETIERIMLSQGTRDARLRLADDVLDNSGTLDQLPDKVRKLHEQYSILARQPKNH
jgi:dephospho-CoA kinase